MDELIEIVKDLEFNGSPTDFGAFAIELNTSTASLK